MHQNHPSPAALFRPLLRAGGILVALAAVVWGSLALASAAMPPVTANPAVVTISGEITGASGKYPIRVTLWDRADFFKKPVQELRLEPAKSFRFALKVPAGTWAVSAFEDRNDNGTLDMGLFGPKEPTGFSRIFTAWRQPRFEEVAVAFDRDTDTANIVLK
jgi:uncharacterized protein (DUF2141 family)